MFFNYVKFLYDTLLRKWSFYITTVFYLFLLCLIMYILPVVMDKNLIIVSKYTFIFMIVILFAVLSVSTIAIQLFRAGIDDGSEIIIIAKPISRSSIVWGKLFVFLTLSLAISGIASFLCCFTIWTEYGGKVIGDSVTLGAFVGTLVIYLIFGSIAVMLSLVVKKLGTILITIGLFCVLIVYGMVASFTINTPAKQLVDDQSVNLRATSLVQKNNQTNQLGYTWGTIATHNGQVVTQQYLNETLGQNAHINPGDYLSTKWKEASDNPGFDAIMYTNFLYQFVNLYTLNWEEQFDVPFTIYQTIVSSNASPYIDLKFKNVYLNDENSQQAKDFKQSLIAVNYQKYEDKNDSEDDNLIPSDKSTLEEGNNQSGSNNSKPIDPIAVDNTYYLTNNIRFGAVNLSSQAITVTDFGTTYAQGDISGLSDTQISLPWFYSTKPSSLVAEYALSSSFAGSIVGDAIGIVANHSIQEKTFTISDSTSETNKYDSFINTFYSEKWTNIISKLDEYLTEKLQFSINPLSIYATVFAMYDVVNYMNQMPPTELFKKENIDKLLNKLAVQVSGFQYWTALALQNMEKTNANELKSQAKVMMQVLVPSDFDNVNNIAVLVMTPANLITTLNLLKSDPQQASKNIKQALYGIYPFFTLTHEDDLDSFTIAKGANYYDMPSLVGAWVGVSFMFMFVAIALYSRRDFS